MIDTTLIDKLTEMAEKEKKIKEFKRRLRIKGKVIQKGVTKRGNLTLTVKKGDDKFKFKFTVLQSHKERFALAENIDVGKSISIQGIPRFRMAICTKLKHLEKGIDDSKQVKLI